MSMEIRRFEPRDFKEVSSWYHKRNLPHMPEELLPTLGFVVPGIAAAFLYRTDSKLAFLESCVANPETEKLERTLALNLLLKEITLAAKSEGIKLLIASSIRPTIADICLEHGFTEIGEYKTFAKELTWERP